MTTTEVSIPRLKQRYRDEIVPALREEFGFGNVMEVPRVVKVIVNMGVGEAARDAKLIRAQFATSHSSPGKRRRSPRPVSQSRSSSCARECRLART